MMSVAELIQELSSIENKDAEVVCLITGTSFFPYSVEEAQEDDADEAYGAGDVLIYLNDC